jgi:parvulin-like peptidyl-prolyl isomerase
MNRFKFLSITLAALALAGSLPAQYSNGIAAVVNGKVITQSEVRDAIKAQEQMLAMQYREDIAGFQRAAAELRDSALDSLVERELILAEFKKIGGEIKQRYVDDDINSIIIESFKGDRDAFVTELAKTGMTMKKFRELREKMIVLQVMRGKFAQDVPPATPREVDEYYKENQSDWREGDLIKISTITIPRFSGEEGATPEKQKALAREIRGKVAGGADFATMAKTYSQDSKADNGGEWEWMERSQMKKSYGDAAFALGSGGLSQVIEDETAYVIITLDAKKYGTVAPLTELRDEIEKRILSDKAKSALDKWLEGLRRRAVIKKM